MKFDRNTLTRLSRVIRRVEALPPEIEQRRIFDSGVGHSFVKIISSVQTSSYRWQYTGRPMKYDPSTGTLIEDINAPDVTDILNLCEAYNLDSNGYAGCGVKPANLPTGFTIQPLSRGTPVLELFFGKYISMTNGVDGSC